MGTPCFLAASAAIWMPWGRVSGIIVSKAFAHGADVGTFQLADHPMLARATRLSVVVQINHVLAVRPAAGAHPKARRLVVHGSDLVSVAHVVGTIRSPSHSPSPYDSVGRGSTLAETEPLQSLTTVTLGFGSTGLELTENPCVGGSIPSPATTFSPVFMRVFSTSAKIRANPLFLCGLPVAYFCGSEIFFLRRSFRRNQATRSHSRVTSSREFLLRIFERNETRFRVI